LNTVTTPDLNQRYSLGIRIWHWILFIVLIASLITVGLASTLFRTRNTISLVSTQLAKKGITVSDDQARAVAHEYNDKLWELHTWLGYILCFLVVARIIIEFFQSRDERLATRIKTALAFRPRDAQERGEQQHYLLVKRAYLVFYAAIIIMALTGIVLAFESVPTFRAWRNPAKSIHALVQYIIYGFVILHLAGVVRADLDRYPGLVSAMINGRKRSSQ
jgi:cytochrome b561